jgi:WD40 repeat protein
MAYSAEQNILISCGFEFDVLIWNPYVNEPICVLRGHEAPIIGVECPESNPAIITADGNGTIKMWDLSDYTLIQTFCVPNILQLKAIKAVPKHRRLIAASRKLHVFEYDRPFIPEMTDDCPIFCAQYNPETLHILICGANSIKIWNAVTGRPSRII